MAIQRDVEAVERERLQPYAEELLAIIREADAEATYAFGPGPDEGIWLLNVYLLPGGGTSRGGNSGSTHHQLLRAGDVLTPPAAPRTLGQHGRRRGGASSDHA